MFDRICLASVRRSLLVELRTRSNILVKPKFLSVCLLPLYGDLDLRKSNLQEICLSVNCANWLIESSKLEPNNGTSDHSWWEKFKIDYWCGVATEPQERTIDLPVLWKEFQQQVWKEEARQFPQSKVPTRLSVLQQVTLVTSQDLQTKKPFCLWGLQQELVCRPVVNGR